MKKLLLLGLGLFSLVAQAQMPDIEVTLTKPATNDNMVAGTAFDFEISIKNTGSSALGMTDTIVNFILVDGQPISNGQGGYIGWFEYPTIAAGGTQTFTHSLTLQGGTTGPIDVCSYAFMLVTESDTTNNTSCNTANWDAAIGVGEFQLLQIVDQSYYSAGAYHVKLDNATSHNDAKISVINLSGQEILNADLEINNGSIDQRIELGRLPSGIYLMNISSSKGVISTQKVMVH